MSTLYLLVLAGVALIIVASVVEAVIAVSRKPNWQSEAMTPRLSLVTPVDRRTTQLPFVGNDRREVETADVPEKSALPRQAA